MLIVNFNEIPNINTNNSVNSQSIKLIVLIIYIRNLHFSVTQLYI